jgi:hypothetical protein
MNHVQRGCSACCALAFGLLPSVILAQTRVSLAVIQTRESSETERVETALARPITLKEVDVALHVLTKTIADQAGIHVTLSKKIEDAGVQRDQKVTAVSRGLSLESLLNKVLADLNLTLMVKNESLIITTVEDAQSPENMVTRVYPVRDLVSLRGRLNFDPLVKLISSTVEPDSWQDVGGPGAIYANPNAGALVLSQRRDIHQRVEALILTLRRAKALPDKASVVADGEDRESGKPSQGVPLNKLGPPSSNRSKPARTNPWPLPQMYQSSY